MRPPSPRSPKSIAVAYAALALFGEVGGHRFYMGRPATGSLMACLTLLPILGSLVALADGDPASLLDPRFGWAAYVPTGIVLAWMFVDAFLIPRWVEASRHLGGDAPGR